MMPCFVFGETPFRKFIVEHRRINLYKLICLVTPRIRFTALMTPFGWIRASSRYHTLNTVFPVYWVSHSLDSDIDESY